MKICVQTLGDDVETCKMFFKKKAERFFEQYTHGTFFILLAISLNENLSDESIRSNPADRYRSVDFYFLCNVEW